MKRQLYHKSLHADMLVFEDVLSKQDTFLYTKLKFYFECMGRVGALRRMEWLFVVFWVWGFFIFDGLFGGFVVVFGCCFCLFICLFVLGFLGR